MTTTLTLQILEEDIRETDYFNHEDCVITRALARAGRPDLYDDGELSKNDRTIAKTSNNQSYFDLVYKVLGMYKTIAKVRGVMNSLSGDSITVEALPIQDFEHTLIFEE